MFIENPEALKTWLTASLEPLCDADPAALSKYVLALIKKDKPLEDLKESMAQQMDVFLQGETKLFVDKLFEALESKIYLNKDASYTKAETIADEGNITGNPDIEKENEGPIKNEKIDIDASGKPDSTTTPSANEQIVDNRRHSGSGGTDSRRFREESINVRSGDNQAAFKQAKVAFPLQQVVATNPEDICSNDFQFSYSSEVDYQLIMDDRAYRGRRSGPLTSQRHSSPSSRRRYRRPISPPHSGQQMGASNRRFRSRSPPSRGSRLRGRSPDRYARIVRSRSISPERIRRRSHSRSRSRSPTHARLRIQASPDPPGYVPSTRAPRCRDYDEKGFCMRGDQCKFDHGNDAVILADSVGGGVPAYNPAAPSTAPSSLDTTVPPPSPMHPMLTPSAIDPYVPAGSVIIDPNIPPPVAKESMPPLHLPPPGFTAPIHVPPPSSQFGPITGQKRSFEGGYNEPGNSMLGPPAKRGFDYKRLGRGNRGGQRGRGYTGHGGISAQLAVRNIPLPLNNIGLLNNHFGKFGTLVNVQVHFEGDPASALISYSDPSEAEGAMNCSDAVLANRFIKIFYHHQNSAKNVRDRLGVSSGKVELSGDMLTKTILNQDASASQQAQMKEESKTADRAAAIAAIKKNQDVLEAKARMKKDAQNKQTEAAKRLIELRNGKQQLLDKLLAEQKKLIAKIETKKENGEDMKPDERAAIMKLIKTLSESIVKTKDELQKMIHASSNKLTPSELQKALLDAELELFTAQADGSDTSEVQKRVNSLTVECARKGILPTSRSPGGRGGMGSRGGMGRGGYIAGMGRGSRGNFGRSRGYRGRGGRGNQHFQTSVDRRPSKIIINGFNADDKEAIVAQFQKFGEVLETIEEDIAEGESGTFSLIVHYRTRKEAELAMMQGKNFGEQPLKLNWYVGTTPVDLQTQLSTEEMGGAISEVGSDILLADPDDDYQPLDPAYLPPGLEDEDKCDKDLEEASRLEYDETLLDEEEEEEDDDDEEEGERSWKR